MFGNMGDMLKKVGEMQKNLKSIQQELKAEAFEANEDGVNCIVSGEMEIKEIKIDPAIVDPRSVNKLEDAVARAVSRAVRDARDSAMKKFRKLTGGLSIPGLF